MIRGQALFVGGLMTSATWRGFGLSKISQALVNGPLNLATGASGLLTTPVMTSTH